MTLDLLPRAPVPPCPLSEVHTSTFPEAGARTYHTHTTYYRYCQVTLEAMGPLSDEVRASHAAEAHKGSITAAATSPPRPISAATSPRTTTEDSDRGSDADRRSSGRGGSIRLGPDHLGTLMQNNRCALPSCPCP